MTTWTTIFPDLPASPLRGRPADYQAAFTQASRLAEATTVVRTQFGRMRSGQIDELRGGAAIGLVEVVEGVDHRLSDLPPVFAGLEHVFRTHADQLDELDREVARALARAEARWVTHRSDSSRHATEAAALATIADQLEALRAAPEPGAEQELAVAESRWRRQRDTVSWWQARAAESSELLTASRAEFHRLADAESELVTTTAAALRAIDLADLADSNGLWNLLETAFGVLFQAGAIVLDAIVDAAIETLAALATALLTLAQVVFVESLRLLALALKAALYTLATVVVMALAHLAVLAGLVATGVFLMLPPNMKAQVIVAAAQLLALLLRVDRNGDPGGTYDAIVEGLWPDGVPGEDTAPEEDGRAAIVAALELTADGATVNDDEFALVQLDNGKYILVLPGVTDLTNPGPGLNPHHRTVRDVDQHALPSSTSTGMDDNLYAQMVAEALRRHGVPPGSEIMIVGHSFGADTALDLAADPRFNGPGAYSVTHVAAAAYNSGPQARHVPAGTEMLVLQNNKDVPVQVENFGYHPVGLVDSFNDALDRFIARDPLGGFAELGNTGGHAAGIVVDGVGVRYGGRSPVADTQEPGVYEPVPGHVVSVFDGGTAGAGHAQSNYTDYLTTHQSTEVAGFEASVGAAGYGGSGEVITFDVSVPVP